MVIAAASRWESKHICFHSDNMVVVAVIYTRSAKSLLLMHLLRCFAFYSAYFRFHFTARHMPGVLNTAVDALSRNNLQLFSSLVPQAQESSILPSLYNLLLGTRLDWGSPAWSQLFSHSLREVSLAPTLASYESGKNRYLSFCSQFNLAPHYQSMNPTYST